MKLQEVEVRNIKGIRTLDVDLSTMQNAVIIAGKNGAGKSSFLDAIQYLFAGKREIPEDVIRHGEDTAAIFAVLEDGTTITREFKKDGKVKLEVITKEGARVAAPQTLLNKLVEGVNGGKAILFDPNKFSTMNQADVIQVIKDTMGINTDKIDAEYARKFAERRQLKKDTEAYKNMIAAAPRRQPYAVEPLAELQKQHAELKERHNSYLRAVEQRINVQRNIETLQAQLQQERAKLDKLNAISLIEPPPIEELEEKILLAKENEQIKREHEALELQLADLDTYTKNVEQLTTQLADLKAKQQQAVEQAETFPIDGLQIKDGNVYIDGTLLENISQGERLILGVQAAIALQPQLKLLLIRDASLLDEDHLHSIMDVADKTDTSILLEVVGNPPETSILITNGERG